MKILKFSDYNFIYLKSRFLQAKLDFQVKFYKKSSKSYTELLEKKDR